MIGFKIVNKYSNRAIRRRTSLPFYLMLFFLSLGIFLTSSPRPVTAREVSFQEIEAQAFVLMEFSRGEVVHGYNEDKPLPPASLTKIMTLLLAYEALEEGRANWDDQVTVSEKAWRTGGSQMFLDANQVVTFGELVTGIATISANDACVAVAEYLSGSEDNFVATMNRKAQELGLNSTLFQNTSGLSHEAHYSSALDMARLSQYYISRFPESLELHAQQHLTFNNIPQDNRNPLLGRFPGADGLKTGHTSAAGYCLIATAEQSDMRFIAVILDSESRASRLSDSEILFNYAFRNYTLHPVFTAGEVTSLAEVSGGTIRQVELQTKEAVEVIIPFHRQDDLVIDFNFPENLAAPLTKHETIGRVKVYLDDTLLDQTSLIVAHDVEKAGFIALQWRSVSDFVTTLWSSVVEWLEGLLP